MSKKKTEQPEFPHFLPVPQHIELLEGTTELSPDVRLATSNVIPYMRKTMRSIFTAAAIRVVANKKRFVIQVNIIDESEANWDDVPEPLRSDYYQMEILNNVVTISSPSQVGAIWGVQSFADLYQSQGPDVLIPNCLIRDWAQIAVRGASVEATAMVERMRLDEYGTVIDRLARARMNTLIVGLYRAADADQKVEEALLVPFPEHSELTREAGLTWETAQIAPVPEGAYDPAPPVMVSEDYLATLISYGRERGLQVIPSLDFTEMTDLLKTVCPTAGKLGDSTFRDLVEELYGSLLTRYCPDGLPCFHVSLAAAGSGEVADYAAWLVEVLTAKGVDKVLIDSCAASKAMVATLKKTGLLEKTVFLGASDIPGVVCWDSLQLGGDDWRGFAEKTTPEIPADCEHGFICATSIDSPWVFREYIAAVIGWNRQGTEDTEACRKQGMKNMSGRFYDIFVSALPDLRQACAAMPEVLLSVPVNQPDGGQKYVAAVKKALGKDAVARLDAVLEPARAAYEKFMPMVNTEGESTPFPTVTKTFVGEATRMLGVALACKVAIQKAPEEGKTWAQTVDDFTEAMQGVSSYKPRYMVPGLLSGFTMLRNLLKSMA